MHVLSNFRTYDQYPTLIFRIGIFRTAYLSGTIAQPVAEQPLVGTSHGQKSDTRAVKYRSESVVNHLGFSPDRVSGIGQG